MLRRRVDVRRLGEKREVRAGSIISGGWTAYTRADSSSYYCRVDQLRVSTDMDLGILTPGRESLVVSLSLTPRVFDDSIHQQFRFDLRNLG